MEVKKTASWSEIKCGLPVTLCFWDNIFQYFKVSTYGLVTYTKGLSEITSLSSQDRDKVCTHHAPPASLVGLNLDMLLSIHGLKLCYLH